MSLLSLVTHHPRVSPMLYSRARLFVSSLLIVGGLTACPNDPAPSDETGSSDESGSGSGGATQWTELAPEIDGGVLLSAAEVGGALTFVGGDLSSQPGVTPGGPGYIVRLGEDGWCREEGVAPHTLWWIDAPSADEFYAVGDQGTIIHEVAGVRTDESVETDAVLYGVYDQGDRVIAVGGDVWETQQGEVWVRDSAGEWSALAQELPGVVFKVWDQWLVGIGVAWTLEGDTLVEHHPAGGERLLTVHGTSSDDVWAVGGLQQPVLLHWTGGAWESIAVDPFCATGGLNGVWVSEQGEVWIAGFFGGLGVYRDGEWECPDPRPTREHFHMVRGYEDGIFLGGGDLFSAGDNYGSVFYFGESGVQAPDTLPACG